MSSKPAEGKDQGKGQDKKKKFAPPTENELAKQKLMELDEEELEHRRQLDLKYRDRARERREGAMEGEDQDSDNENPVAEDGDQEYNITAKGLDLDLFIKQKEKERAELLAAKEGSGKMQVENGEDEKAKNKKITAKTNLGLGIQRVLFKDSSKRDGQRNIFKSGNCYEFDLDLNFGSNLPSLVIRSRDKNLEEEPVSIEISDRIHQKLGQIMTYIKTGKKPDVPKGPDASEFHKAMAIKSHPVNQPHLSDESDEDDIFPDAKKKLKTENGPRIPVATVDESNQVVMKGLFSSLKHGDGKDKIMFEKVHPKLLDSIEIEREDQTAVHNKMIQEKNKKLIAELAQKRAEEKLAKLQQQDDYYTECFPEDIPELEALKESQKRADQSRRGGKSKKKGLGKQVEQVTRIMDEKKKGRGGD